MEWRDLKFLPRLRAAMEREQATLTQIASTAGVKEETIRSWNRNQPSPFQIYKIAQFLNLSPSYLAYGDTSTLAADEQTLLTDWRLLSAREREIIRDQIGKFAGSIPLGTVISTKAEGKQYDAPPAKVGEPAAIYPEKKIKPINRRDELAVFPVAKKGARGAVPIESWENLAAGFGEDLAKGELTYIRELPDWRGVHSLFVRGDSMEQTLLDGDLILVQQFPNGHLDLQPKGEGPKNSRAQLEQFVPNDKLFILAIGEGAGDEFHSISGPTIKRVRYQGGTDWELFIDADNPLVWPSQKIRSKHSVRFYARVMGLGDGKYTKQYPKR